MTLSTTRYDKGGDDYRRMTLSKFRVITSKQGEKTMLKTVKSLVNFAESATWNKPVAVKRIGNHVAGVIKNGNTITIYYNYHSTTVCRITKTLINAQTWHTYVEYSYGGWHTASTTRAINAYKEIYGVGITYDNEDLSK